MKNTRKPSTRSAEVRTAIVPNLSRKYPKLSRIWDSAGKARLGNKGLSVVALVVPTVPTYKFRVPSEELSDPDLETEIEEFIRS